MKVHKATLLIVDFDDIGAGEVRDVLEHARYPNHCMSPEVLSIETKDIGEWDDSHPLNNIAERDDEIKKLFG